MGEKNVFFKKTAGGFKEADESIHCMITLFLKMWLVYVELLLIYDFTSVKFNKLNLKSTQMHSSEIKTSFPLLSGKHIQTLLHVKGLSSDVQDWHLGCQHSNSVDWQIIKTSLQLRTPIRRPKKEVHLPSEMAFMFSRAAWADLNGKKAARLTMLLNFPMLSTLSSTWNTDGQSSQTYSNRRKDSTSTKEAKTEDPPEAATCRSPPLLWRRTARSLPHARTTRATAPAGSKCVRLRSEPDKYWHEITYIATTSYVVR